MTKIATITAEQCAAAREIIAKADAFWKANATYDKSGASSMSAELSAHPDHANASNALRGLVEQYETLRDLPDRISAYVSSGGEFVTTWTGDCLGTLRCTASWKNPGQWAPMRQYVASIGGKRYKGRAQGEGMLINLKATGGAA